MKNNIASTLALGLLFATAPFAVAHTRPHSTQILIQTLTEIPALAHTQAQSIALHATNNGRTLLYLESDNGAKLSVLDVTDPASIRVVAQKEIEASGTYDFIGETAQAAIVRFRDTGRLALLDESHPERPSLLQDALLDQRATTEALGVNGLLLADAPATSFSETSTNYKVIDTSDSRAPQLLTTVPGVAQRLYNATTGTLFLRNSDGVTIVRRLRPEQEHRTEMLQQAGN